MILQELIRNVIIYREVLKPVISSWKDSIAAGYYRNIGDIPSGELNLALNKAKALEDGEEFGWDISDEYDSRSLSKTSGTRTITNHMIITERGSDLYYKVKRTFEPASISKGVHIMLTGNHMHENAVGIGKTSAQTVVLNNDFMISGSLHGANATTGYESKQINSFLFETHEKRESLGEFSLTHEETPLMYLKEGGEYHDFH